jgi:hypothetical protein
MRNSEVDQLALGSLPGTLEMNGFSFSEFGGIFACYLI